MTMRVLLFCPTLRLEPETVQAIMAQEWDGALDVLFTRDNPFPVSNHDEYRIGEFANIAHAYHKAQLLAIAGGYDALYIVESDMIPPADALKRLAEMNVPVAYGTYVLRHGKAVLNVLRWEGRPQLGMSLSFYMDEVRREWGKAIRCSGIGHGCILIRRDVLLKLALRPGPGYTAPDWAFAEDCLRLGIEQWAHLGVLCGHKTPDGRVLWPGLEETMAWKLKMLKDVNYRGMALRAGQEITVSDETAVYDLTRTGHADLLDAGRADNGLRDDDATENVPEHQRKQRRRAAG